MNQNMLEIERKFLVKPEISEFFKTANSKKIIQGYLTKNELGSVRVRIVIPSKSFYLESYLMSKTKVDEMTNNETVDPINIKNAEILINQFCSTVIRKTRYDFLVVEPDGFNRNWEIDVFESPNNGLMLAECELDSKDTLLWLPPWIEKEVTGQADYYNANM